LSAAGQATSRLCFRSLSSTTVALSHLSLPPLISSLLPPLPYLVADCHVLATRDPHRALSDASARGIDDRGPLPPAAAMVVILVVVGRWRLGGAILCSAMFFSVESLQKMLASETKIAELITQASARNRNLKLRNSD